MPSETLGSRPGSVVTGRDRGVRGAMHNWPSVVRVREGLAGRDILVSSRTNNSCGGPVAVHTLVWLASGLVAVRLGWVVFRRMHFKFMNF